jgi:TP901 family phage tail tape measure protein
MAGKIKGIIVEIGGDTSGLQKALSKVNSVTSSLSKELRGVNSLLKLDPSNTELLSQKQIVLKNNIEATRNKLVQLKDVQEQALQKGIDKNEEQQENWRKLQRDIVATENKLKQLLLEDSAWNINGKKIEAFGEKIIKVSSKIDNLGSKLTKTLTTSVLALGVASSKSAIDFESAFAGVEKTVDGTAEQMASLKQGIRDMSKEIPSSATEISAVAEAAGQLGIQTDNILGFSKVMIDMGNSTNLSSDEAATSLARFANITQMSQKDFNKLGSSIVDLGNNFATTESEIVDMALRLAGAGHQVGMSEGQILGLATALSSVGIEAEMGGSAMSKALVKMQNAVEMGSGKLQTVLKKLNMSLRELELSAANDSMGFKSLCDSIGMTSTEVKQLITAGTNLEDFASISGMSAEQFKKAWKDDATSALTSFIKGLGDAENKGESAITMLSEMGLTEVRLRDSLLRAANAGNLFNSAIETGTKAWGENVALTNEANKRYETTESKLKITINKLKDFGTTIGNKLLPSFNRILDSSEKWLKKLEKMDEATLDNIIKIGLFVAAVGPLVSVLGKIGTVSGNTIKYLGKFAQKIGELDVKSKTATTTFSKFSNGLGSFAGKASLVVAGTSAIIGILTSLDKKINETVQKSLSASDDFINNISMQNQARQNNIDAINETLNANLSEINNVKSLKKELSSLVDENGKVKNGYELRTKFILNELNKALGTEYSQTDNIINNYRNLQDEIDKLILKKKAQIILDANEEKYKDAIKNKTKLYEDYLATQKAIADKKQEIVDINSQWYLFEGDRLSDLKKAEEQYNNLNNILKEQSQKINEYSYDIQKYEENSKLILSGKAEDLKKIEQSTTETYKSVTNAQEQELSKRVKNETDTLNQKKKIYDIEKQVNKDAKNSIYATNVEESQKNVSLIAEELVSMTSSVNELSPELIAAWTTLATNSRENYNNAIAQMPKDMQDKINEITAFVRNDTSVKDAAKFLGQEAVNQLNISSKFEEAGKNWIKGVSKGINNKLLRQEALSSMHSFGVEGLNAIRQQAWDEHSPSKETEKAAKNLLKGVTKGINKEKSSTISNMLKFGQELMNKFNGVMSLNFNSLQNIPKIQSSISQTINTQLQPKILQPNIIINTQHLDNNEMNKIIDTVNKRFGMQI